MREGPARHGSLAWLGAGAAAAATVIITGILLERPDPPRTVATQSLAQDGPAGAWWLVTQAAGAVTISGGDGTPAVLRDEHTLRITPAASPPRDVPLAPLTVSTAHTRTVGRTWHGYGNEQTSTVIALSWAGALPHAWEPLLAQRRQALLHLLRDGRGPEASWWEPFTWYDWLRSLTWDIAYGGHTYEAWAEDRIVALGPTWLVLTSDVYAYTGGAHGNRAITPTTWQLVNGHPQRLDVATLFRHHTLPWEHLSPVLNEAYAAWMSRQGLPGTAVEGDFRQGTPWPRADGLVVHYDPYLIGPWAAGPIDLPVPLAAFAADLDPDGPARHWWPQVFAPAP